ncbi:hypothetical protein [Mycobacterium marinum]|uniref:hypothetical protein n=1 Tax=Mycobacterium marinum TaxID=1781 RepID=UPI00356911DE
MWAVIDRGNSVGLVTPMGLVFLVGLHRRRWKLVTVMVVLAALVKPQFALLAVALFAARQWRLGGIAVVGIAFSNLAAYLLWPRDLPRTIGQSIHGILNYGGSLSMLVGPYNVSFGKGTLSIADTIGHPLSNGFVDGARLRIGYVVLAVVVVSVLVLGRRISPVMVGISLLAAASLFPVLVYQTYLVFALPVAALVVRDPEGPPGSGIFDRLAVLGDRRRAVGICVGGAVALSIAHIPLPGPPMLTPIAGQMGVIGVVGNTPIVHTTAALAPVAWMIACAAIVISYARRPVPGTSDTSESDQTEPVAAS